MTSLVSAHEPMTTPAILPARVVFLTNYLRPCHVAVLRAFRERVRELMVLLSTPMEADRSWVPTWGDLPVCVQRNWTWTRTWRHSSGFREDNFIHIPYDTIAQLRRWQPDIVFSAELGMRTLFASLYRMLSWRTPVVSICNMSERIENERGFGRRLLRRLLKRRINYFTYNGPSCLRYLRHLGIRDDRLFYYPYYYDSDKVYRGQKEFSRDGVTRILFVGNANPRKGIEPMVAALSRWSQGHRDRSVRLIVCGRGPLMDQFDSLSSYGIQVDRRGDCDDAALREAYREADVLWFPTLADEWGLVAIEAWGSGVPVLGSRYAQSIEELGLEGENGWFFCTDNRDELDTSLSRALEATPERLQAMSERCRRTIARFTADFAADRLCDVIRAAIPSLGTGQPSPEARRFQINLDESEP